MLGLVLFMLSRLSYRLNKLMDVEEYDVIISSNSNYHIKASALGINPKLVERRVKLLYEFRIPHIAVDDVVVTGELHGTRNIFKKYLLDIRISVNK